MARKRTRPDAVDPRAESPRYVDSKNKKNGRGKGKSDSKLDRTAPETRPTGKGKGKRKNLRRKTKRQEKPDEAEETLPKEAGSISLSSHIDVSKYVSALTVDTVKQYLIYSLMVVMTMICARSINFLEQAQSKVNFTLNAFWVATVDCTAACLRRVNYFPCCCIAVALVAPHECMFSARLVWWLLFRYG